MRNTVPVLFAIALSSLLLGGCANKPKETGFLSSYAKLEPVDGSSTFLRYVAPDKKLAEYKGAILDPVQVHFYDPASEKGVSQKDINHLEQYFYTQLQNDLKAQRFNLVANPGPGVLRIRIALTDLKKDTPALNIIPQTKLTGVGLGQASAEVEAVDSQTGEQLAAAVMSQTGSRFSFSGIHEWGDVEAVVSDWSKRISKRWAEARDNMKPAAE